MKKQEKKSAMSKKSLAMIQKPVIVEPLLAKSSSRVWRPDYEADAPPLSYLAAFFMPGIQGAVYPQPTHSRSRFWAAMWETARSAGASYRFANLHSLPFLRWRRSKGFKILNEEVSL